MAKIIGYESKLLRQVTCRECTAIIEYKPNEPVYNGQIDEHTKIKGLYCPECSEFIRTNDKE